MAYKLIKFTAAAELAEHAASDWLAELRERSGKTGSGPYTVALSGGRITKNFFEEIVKQVRDNAGDLARVFENVHFFWADERCAPPSDPESNYAMARELLFEPLNIPAGQIHRLRGEGPEPEALKEAIGDICRLAPVSNGQPALDMIFLGMGEDGHTSSLFPGEAKEVMDNPAIYRAVTAVKPPPRRMTLGYATIAAAREAWVLASGNGKQEALQKTLSPESKTPLGRVIGLRKQTVIYTDIETGPKRS
jgi:6-phosphogluconolactonase